MTDFMERAHEAACARIQRRLGELGATDATGGMMPGGLMPDFGASGSLLIYRTRTRDGVRSTDPDYIGVLAEEPWLNDSDLEALDRHVSRHVRRTLRRQAIEKAGIKEGAADPPWSHTMHRLARAALLEIGIDPLIMATPSTRLTEVVVEQLALDKGATVGSHQIEDGRIDVGTIAWRGLEIVGKGRPCVIIDQPLPETLVTALPGRPLSAAVSHPAIERAGPIRIAAADTNANFTTIVLEDVQDHVRRPPAGTDRRWTRIPFMPRHDE